ncbi:MAG: F0F1 ATP synthase subunit gamma [Alphaproteobacteria bacterium]|nr:F0F1 ATP synthase subunit gamma [Alphaproteobacteria bacterium]
MAGLKELKVRIASVKSTRKITKAMQLVAAAKLRRAQEAAVAARPYSDRMDAVIANLAATMKGAAGAPPLLVGTGSDKVHLLLVLTAERGLCGGFNSSIVRLAREHVERLKAEGKTVKLFLVGKKGYDALKRNYANLIVARGDLVGVRQLAFKQAADISQRVLKMFADGEFDVCTMFYARFQSVVSQKPTAHQLIPVDVAAREGGAPDFGGAVYEYEPDEEGILKALLPRNIASQIFRALLENAASEQGARMSAMDNATRNAGDMIDGLTLKFNRTRQAQITKELIEIISGAEAV